MTSSPASVPRFHGQIRGLDGLRGLAIFLVMVLHLWRPEGTTTLGAAIGRVTHIGWVGVDLFFVLSGFLITGVLMDTREDPHYLRNFFARRVLRIFPLYYLFLLITLVLLPIFVREMHLGRYPGYQYSADAAAWPWYVAYASNLRMMMLGDFSPGYANSLTWSLAIEEQFYLVWPFLILLCPPKRLLSLIAAVFAGAIALRAMLALAGSSWLTIFLLTPCRLDTLAAGAFLAAYLRSPGCDPAFWRRLSNGALLCLPVALAWLLIAGDPVREGLGFQVAGYSLLAAGWAGLLCKVLDRRSLPLARLFESRPFVSLGKYSYGIYLFHLLAFVVVYPLAYKWVLSWARIPLVERFFWLVAGIAGSWLLAVLLYHGYESRFLRLKRYFAPRAAAEPETVTVTPA